MCDYYMASEASCGAKLKMSFLIRVHFHGWFDPAITIAFFKSFTLIGLSYPLLLRFHVEGRLMNCQNALWYPTCKWTISYLMRNIKTQTHATLKRFDYIGFENLAFFVLFRKNAENVIAKRRCLKTCHFWKNDMKILSFKKLRVPRSDQHVL